MHLQRAQLRACKAERLEQAAELSWSEDATHLHPVSAARWGRLVAEDDADAECMQCNRFASSAAADSSAQAARSGTPSLLSRCAALRTSIQSPPHAGGTGDSSLKTMSIVRRGSMWRSIEAFSSRMKSSKLSAWGSSGSAGFCSKSGQCTA